MPIAMPYMNVGMKKPQNSDHVFIRGLVWHRWSGQRQEIFPLAPAGAGGSNTMSDNPTTETRPDPHTDAPASAEEESLVRAMVIHELGDAAGDAIVRMERAKGGLQYVSIDVFRLNTDALRALDRLYQAVK
jgi:hypothetical protein